jgi:hypothetical protein
MHISHLKNEEAHVIVYIRNLLYLKLTVKSRAMYHFFALLKIYFTCESRNPCLAVFEVMWEALE